MSMSGANWNASVCRWTLVVTLLGGVTPTNGAAATERAAVTLPNGAVYTVEVPRNQVDRERGLMFRRRLPDRTGMLFVFPSRDRHAIWMKNCLIPLDLIWLDDARRVVAVLPDTPPCPKDPCPIYQPDAAGRYVLELAGGAAKREGVKVGSVLRFDVAISGPKGDTAPSGRPTK